MLERGSSDIRANEPLDGSSVFLVETGESRTTPETRFADRVVFLLSKKT